MAALRRTDAIERATTPSTRTSSCEQQTSRAPFFFKDDSVDKLDESDSDVSTPMGSPFTSPRGGHVRDDFSALSRPREHPSEGSKLHSKGSCKPCLYFWSPKGCLNGMDCEHCHACHKQGCSEDAKLATKDPHNLEPEFNHKTTGQVGQYYHAKQVAASLVEIPSKNISQAYPSLLTRYVEKQTFDEEGRRKRVARFVQRHSAQLPAELQPANH